MPQRPARPGLAVLGAVALVAAFPPWDAWFLAPLGPAALVLAVRGTRPRAAFGYGVLFGVVFLGGLLTWMLNLGVVALVLLVAIQSLFFGGLGLLVRVLWDLPGRLFAVPCAWVAVEALRGRVPWGGFPWGRLGFSQADAPTAGWVAIGGIPLLSWLIAAVGTVLAASVVVDRRMRRYEPGRSRAARRAVAPALVAWIVLLGTEVTHAVTPFTHLVPSGAAAQGATATGDAAPADLAVIAIVQGNVPRTLALAEGSRARQVTINHVRATLRLAAEVDAGGASAPDLVIWPESSVDIDPGRDPATRRLIEAAVSTIGAPVLVGAVLDAPGGRARNVGQLWVPDGFDGAIPTAQYAKRHLVPFGEYIPFRSLLGGIGPLTQVPRDFIPGRGPQVIPAGPVRIGDIICYEVAYDDEATDAVRAGANLLVVQSNNASFMRDGQPGETLQQLAMARLRAIEHDRAVAVATTTGISAVIDPDGSVRAQTPLWRAATIVEEVDLRSTRTLASRAGGWPELLLVIGAFIIPAAGARTRSARRRLRSTSDAHTDIASDPTPECVPTGRGI